MVGSDWLCGMLKENMESKYDNRIGRWTEISTAQLSNANNTLLTLATGSLAFIFDKKSFSSIHLDTSAKLDSQMFYYITSLFLLTFSICLGISVLLTRLYDFRISRHLVLTRKRIAEKHAGKTIGRNKHVEINACHRLTVFFKIIFCRLRFLTEQDIDSFKENREPREDFDNLVFYSDVLGTATWRWTKIQVFSFLLAIISYCIHLII